MNNIQEKQIEEKTCSKCNVVRPLSEFYKKKNSLREECISCWKARCAKDYEKRKMKIPSDNLVYLFSEGSMKKCLSCSKEKAFSEFHKSRIQKDGFSVYCKSCKKIDGEIYRKKNNDVIKKRRREKKEKNPNIDRDWWYRKTYGIDIDTYNRMFIEQGGLCKCCGRHQSEFKKSLCVDHHHSTGIVRGLLCIQCNSAIGYVREDASVLRRMIDYIGEKNGK